MKINYLRVFTIMLLILIAIVPIYALEWQNQIVSFTLFPVSFLKAHVFKSIFLSFIFGALIYAFIIEFILLLLGRKKNR